MNWPRVETETLPWSPAPDSYPRRAAKRMPRATFRLIAATPETKGHGTHTWAKFWKADLSRLMATN